MTQKGTLFSSYRPIVHWLLKKAHDENISDMTHLKIQKISYILYGWVYVACNIKLFPQTFEAWKYGPVIRDMYNDLERFGRANIDKNVYKDETETINNIKDYNVKNWLKKIWNYYKLMTAIELTDMTHLEGTP